MSTIKTPFQYLLDLTGAARIKAAKATGDKEAIAKAERFYLGLDESECEFSTPWKNPLAGNKWQVDVTVRTRGFKIPGLRYNTGTLSPMIRPGANIMANKSSLDLSTVTGLYFVDETQQDHLLIHPNTNIYEALKLTGFVFDSASFEVTWYNARNEEQKADGYVDIKHSVVAGRLFLSNIQREVETDPNSKLKNLEPGTTPAVAPVEITGTTETISGTPGEGIQLNTDLPQAEPGIDADDAAIKALLDADQLKLAEGAADKTVAIQDAAKVVPVSEQPSEEAGSESADEKDESTKDSAQQNQKKKK